MIKRLLLTLWVGGIYTAALFAGGDILPQESFQIALDDCDEIAPLCIELPPQQLANIGILHNGTPYAGGMTGCNFQMRFNYSLMGVFDNQTGTFQLTAWTIDNQTITGSFTNIEELVAILNDNDAAGEWSLDNEMIMGGEPSQSYGALMIMLPDNSSAQIAPATTQLPQGTELNFGRGFHQVVLADMVNSCLDTFTVMATCPPTTMVFEDTLVVDDSAIVLCLDTTELTGAVDTIFNDCADSGGNFTNVIIDEALNCVKIRANKADGIDTTCIVICDEFAICDTTIIIITTESDTIYQTDTIDLQIPLNGMDTYCVDTTELTGTITNIENICPEAAGDNIEFTFDTESYCVDYEGFELGSDTVCVVLTDSEGAQDTTILIVEVVPLETDTVFRTVVEGESNIFCPQSTELTGNIISITNICPNESGTFVNFGINNVTLCSEFSGVDLGTESACLVLCDDLGVCDTTILTVTVIPSTNNNLPVAVDDAAATPLDTPTAIDILSNDIIPGTILTEQFILDKAAGGIGLVNGSAVINVNGTLSYSPNTGFCGMDSLQYVICNSFGCDTAKVVIEIGCFSEEPEAFIINTGFSPNDDGVNDTFFIRNVESFVGNELFIFNRWGNQVFRMQNYDNSWTGKFGTLDLPDGTYFYLFRPGDGSELSGWLAIAR
ncbi:MAG: gliding motility-associated C-terminal domain-containing protein [Saprospiraceae bacterium]